VTWGKGRERESQGVSEVSKADLLRAQFAHEDRPAPCEEQERANEKLAGAIQYPKGEHLAILRNQGTARKRNIINVKGAQGALENNTCELTNRKGTQARVFKMEEHCM